MPQQSIMLCALEKLVLIMARGYVLDSKFLLTRNVCMSMVSSGIINVACNAAPSKHV